MSNPPHHRAVNFLADIDVVHAYLGKRSLSIARYAQRVSSLVLAYVLQVRKNGGGEGTVS